ncbi:MAG: peptidyl-prolyl cis-trans isomerase [Campylobacterales bacterium]|nr:peptidyl-prolyl cis-trans isomerase [Campylobacterales bacterium]
MTVFGFTVSSLKTKKLKVFVVAIFIFGVVHYILNKDVVATVEDIKILKAEFEKEMSYYRISDYTNFENKKKLLDEMIDRKLILSKAYDLELDKNPDIQRAFENILIGEIKKRYIEDEIAKISIEKKDIEEYYQNHKEDFATEQKKEFAILFYKKHKIKDKIREDMIHSQLGEIINLYKVNSLPEPKEGFGKYSIDYSEHQASRYRGGIIGKFSVKDFNFWNPELLKIGFELKKIGDITDIIETDDGYYIIHLTNIEPKKYKTFDQSTSLIYHKLVLDKQEEIRDKFKKLLLDEFSIDINEGRLKDTKIVKHIENSQDKKIPQLY